MVIKGLNSMFMNHIFVLVESLALITIYSLLLQFGRTLCSLLIILMFVVCIVDLALVNGILKMNVLAHNTECLLLICIAIIYFFQLLKKTDHQDLNILKSFGFWFNAGVLFYCSGAFFIFLFGNYMIEKSPDEYFALYGIHSIFNITFNSLLAVALTKKTYGN